MATARKRTKRGPFKGRTLVALSLVAFMGVAGLVVYRRSVGISTATAMSAAQREKAALETERITLQRKIRDAQTRSRVIADAERRLGLHVAPETQTRMIAAPQTTP
jgi:hypothetical protein